MTMLEQGFEAVTAESVAAAADVSAATFRNYFASREEAIIEGAVHRMLSLPEALRARPSDEPIWDAVTHVVPEALAEIVGERDHMVVLWRITRQKSALLGQHLAVFDRLQRQLAEAIADRTGTDVDRDLAPRLLAAAVAAAMRTAVEVWATESGPNLPELVKNCLTQMRAGIPIGHAAAP